MYSPCLFSPWHFTETGKSSETQTVSCTDHYTVTRQQQIVAIIRNDQDSREQSKTTVGETLPVPEQKTKGGWPPCYSQSGPWLVSSRIQICRHRSPKSVYYGRVQPRGRICQLLLTWLRASQDALQPLGKPSPFALKANRTFINRSINN